MDPMKDTTRRKPRAPAGAPTARRADARPGEPGSALPEPRGVFPNLVEVARFTRPVLRPGKDGAWDERDIHSHFIIPVGSRLYLYYNGLPEDRSDRGIGLAISEDGITFEKLAGNPIIRVGRPGEWDSGHLWKMDVIRIAPDDWRMWYGGFEKGDTSGRGRIGYATSRDGISWEKHPGNPVLSPGGEAWEEGCVADLRVVYDQHHRKFHALYYGHPKGIRPSAIGYAQSQDGVTWRKYDGNPVMTAIAGGQEGSLISPKHLMKTGDCYVVFYEALHGGRAFHTGNAVAYSYDCIHWVRDPRNPCQIEFGEELPVDPSIVLENGWLRNYYGAITPVGGSVGLSYFVTGPSRKICYPVLSVDALAASASTRLEDSLTVDLSHARSVAFTVQAACGASAAKGIALHLYASPDGVRFDTVDYAVIPLGASAGKTVQRTQFVAPEAGYLRAVVENLDAGSPAGAIRVTATVQAP
jgi:hypothetical protein